MIHITWVVHEIKNGIKGLREKEEKADQLIVFFKFFLTSKKDTLVT